MKVSESIERSNIDQLKEWMPEGSTVYCVLRHVSRSGMQREIGLVVMLADSEYGIMDIHPNYRASEVLGRRMNKRGDGIVCHGCGMDMGFDLVYSLSLKLYGDGYALKSRWL